MTLLKVTFNELRDFRKGKNPQPGPSAPDRVAGGGGWDWDFLNLFGLKAEAPESSTRGTSRRDGTGRSAVFLDSLALRGAAGVGTRVVLRSRVSTATCEACCCCFPFRGVFPPQT